MTERSASQTIELPEDAADWSGDDGPLEQARIVDDLSAALASPGTPPGTVLCPGFGRGGFRLERRLFRDELGENWLARDLTGDRDVALRLLPREKQQSPDQIATIKDSFARLQAIHHQYIAPIHLLSWDEAFGYFLVGQVVNGETLSRFLKGFTTQQGGVTPGQLVELLTPLARALDYLHDRHLSHGDVRPSKIRVCEQGRVAHEVLLTDTGLAGMLASYVDELPQSVVEARGPYLAPEQWTGQPAGPKTDQYSLAVIAYELLAGQTPFVAADGPLREQALDRSMPPISGQPDHVNEALAQALAKNPRERFESCAIFLTRLAVSSDRGRRSRQVQEACDSVDSASGGGGDGSGSGSGGDRSGKGGSGDGSGKGGSGEGKGKSDGTGGKEAKDPKKQAKPVVKLEAIRSFRAASNGVRCVVFSVDGRSTLSGGKDKVLRLSDSTNGQMLRRFDGHSDAVNCVAFSPDGRHAISASDDCTIRIWDATSNSELACLVGHRAAIKSVAFTRDGKFIVSGSEDATVRLWDVATKKEIRRYAGFFNRHKLAINSVAVSADGCLVVSGSADGTVRLWNLKDGSHIRRVQKSEEGITSVAISPDGARIATASYDGTIFLWQTESTDEPRLLKGHNRPVLSIAFHHDSRRLLSGSWDETVRLWDAQAGREICHFQGHTRGVNSVAFSVDGRQAVSAGFDEAIRVWALTAS